MPATTDRTHEEFVEHVRAGRDAVTPALAVDVAVEVALLAGADRGAGAGAAVVVTLRPKRAGMRARLEEPGHFDLPLVMASRGGSSQGSPVVSRGGVEPRTDKRIPLWPLVDRGAHRGGEHDPQDQEAATTASNVA